MCLCFTGAGGDTLASSSNRTTSHRRARNTRTPEPRGPAGPWYYIGGANGAKMYANTVNEEHAQQTKCLARKTYGRGLGPHTRNENEF